jgi:hypothetical protein
MIKKVDGKFIIYDSTGTRKLSKPYSTKAIAEKRLAQIEFFKHKKKGV